MSGSRLRLFGALLGSSGLAVAAVLTFGVTWWIIVRACVSWCREWSILLTAGCGVVAVWVMEDNKQ
jgi:hypothetical protein